MSLPIELAEHLRNLSSELVNARLSASPDHPFDPSKYLAASASLFAALYSVNRESLTSSKNYKAKTHDARLEMDSAHLRLQNLKFEQNHLEREIRKCEEYESTYQTLDLLPISELPQDNLPMDEHELMLYRLEFELSERKRLDEEKKELGLVKAKLVKENEVKKKKLEELELQLDEFVAKAKLIQTKMHAVEGEEKEKEKDVTTNGSS